MHSLLHGISSSGWLLVGCVALCRCTLDDRSPREIVAPNQPEQGESAGTSSAGGAAGAGQGAGGSEGTASAVESPAGGAGTASGVAGGDRPGSAGSGGVGAGDGAAGAAAGASGAGAMGPEGGLDPVELLAGGSGASCPTFTPCGGELAGGWVYSQACPTADVSLLQSLCPAASVEFEPGAAATLSFGDGQVVRTGAPVGDSEVTFPADCGLGGCSTIAPIVGGAGECRESAGGCACRTPFSIDWGQQSYTTSGTQLRLADGRTFEYCVEAELFTYRETGSPREPGVYILRRN